MRFRFGGRLVAALLPVIVCLVVAVPSVAASDQECVVMVQAANSPAISLPFGIDFSFSRAKPATFDSLQAAQDSASAGDTLSVYGYCRGTTTIDKNLTIQGAQSWNILSSILSGRRAAAGQASPDPYLATLDGRGLGTVLTIDDGVAVTVSNLLIQGGNSNHGGGVVNRGNVVLTQTSVRGNSAGGNGGGVYNDGTLTLIESNVSDNTSTSNGGGIFNTFVLNLVNSVVSGNQASNQGGGVYNIGALTLSQHSGISGNSSHQGGGIENGDSVVLNDDSVINNNTSHQGGGIYDEIGGFVTLNGHSEISDNSVDGAGGGIFSYELGRVTLNDESAISGNSAINNGGGIHNGGILKLNGNSAIRGNHAAEGGGVYTAVGSNANLFDSSSITYNTATTDGGGISMNGGTVNLHDSSVVTRNSVSSGTGGGIYHLNGTLHGVVAGPGGNVFYNSPDNIAP